MQSNQAGRAKVVLERVTPETLTQYAPRLAAMTTSHILNHNRSINFIHPFTSHQATELFLKTSSYLSLDGPGRVIMWVAKLPSEESKEALESVDMDGRSTDNADIVGTVQLAFHTSPNGVHRSEVRKLIVDDRYERRGIARTLMDVLQRYAKEEGSKLCLLDTEAGYAEHFYTKLGWKLSGYIPNYAMTPDGLQKRDAALMYLEL
ncbi:hypothetical protein L486_04453 [Kwoniella mangroviensis CBS 10435]|uniref:N-acetyltransferase domain-containing protein n=1 Tax=Kwoniella mangroviensis CBS 10435 TaxID=1331196 RepID=A0A1B9ISD4_9TREE|nr:uncharacterized protein I203_06659 [Kwoniella mangroviensis CBS 8507]OCF58420.1 hypothetical protein L486_04453 [Kwoniella mangroviensis CBS 10435]OCF64075.1 hypothetical protein I203_06659 [Kwoniella mangroviensis CBS 8507]OCF78430.1 hypothetical protein I204_00370 [Kwoniella mangroviensis CBS 8886]